MVQGPFRQPHGIFDVADFFVSGSTLEADSGAGSLSGSVVGGCNVGGWMVMHQPDASAVPGELKYFSYAPASNIDLAPHRGTVEFCYRPNRDTSLFGPIIFHTGDGANNGNVFFWLAGGISMRAAITDVSGSEILDGDFGTFSPVAASTYNLALTWKMSNSAGTPGGASNCARVHLDGVQQGTVACWAQTVEHLAAQRQHCYIGSRDPGFDKTMDGSIRNFRVYSSALYDGNNYTASNCP